jgi:hypothetical protein
VAYQSCGFASVSTFEAGSSAPLLRPLSRTALEEAQGLPAGRATVAKLATALAMRNAAADEAGGRGDAVVMRLPRRGRKTPWLGYLVVLVMWLPMHAGSPPTRLSSQPLGRPTTRRGDGSMAVRGWAVRRQRGRAHLPFGLASSAREESESRNGIS